MRTGILFALSLFSFSILMAQPAKEAKVKSLLLIAPGTKVGGTATLQFTAVPNPEWHIYSLESTGAYKNTEIVLSDKCTDIQSKGTPGEDGKKITEFDELMGGNLNYFDGPVVFSQPVILKGKKPHVEGFIEFQLCNGDKCIFITENFVLEGKVK